MVGTLRTLGTLSGYGASIIPCARREIRRWAEVATAIPDPALRSHATDAIVVDASNAEAVAALAATVPRRRRRTAVELLVAYQVLVDYVDTLGERVCADQLARGFAIGTALTAAIAPPVSPLDIDPLGDDGGYLMALVSTCRGRLWQLPSAGVVERQAEAAAIRCAHALAHTHTASRQGTTAELRQWTTQQDDTADYAWWEVAAGGNSSIAILALLAAAADPSISGDAATALAASYWPHVCVMSTMLDSLVDYERDRASGEFSFVAHYPDETAARDGLIRATTCSLAATKPLRRSHAHSMIVCGIAGYYAASATRDSLASRVAPSLIPALGPAATPIMLALRARHRFRADRGS